MALVLADRVLETTTTAGSGTITLAGAEPGYQSFSAVGNGNQTYYTIANGAEWEVGIGTYTASGTTLSRDTVLSSSANGAKVTLSAGTKNVFVTYPSEKSVNRNVSGNISVSSAVITDVGYPNADSDAATKSYVDNMTTAALHIHTPVVLATPGSTGRTDTYNNGTAGVSATLTATANGTLTIDSTVAQATQRVLIKDCTNQVGNGVYVVTTVGDGSTAYVMTRAADADTYGEQGADSLDEGSYFFVTGGTSQEGAAFVCNTPGVIVFGSTNITFAQFSQAQVYDAGVGISLTGTTISLVSPVVVSNGGTGLTSTPTNGQLLIGNGTNYTLSTLTAGSGVSITNSAGSITLSATGTGGTVVEVKATSPLASSGGTSPTISIANSTGTGSVVLDQGATISSATITAALSASITTITGTSANITTVTGTTAGFSSANITQLQSTSATITTLSGTNVTYSSGTVSQLAATSATIATVSGTNVTYSNGSFTSATVSTISGTTATYTSATVTNLALTSITLSNISVASATITTGNLTFSSTGQRITGDMSNATVASRLLFQNSVTNGASYIQVIPNGTASVAGLLAYASSSDPGNTSAFQTRVALDNNECALYSTRTGTGTYLPMTFYTGGSERMRLDTSGNLGIGTASPGTKLHVDGGAASTYVRVSNTGSTNGLYVGVDSAGESILSAVDAKPMKFLTTNTERMRIDSSGNVGIGGTANAFAKVEALGTYPTSGGYTRVFRASGTIPSGTTQGTFSHNSFQSIVSTQAAAFTCPEVMHFQADNVTLGASSAVTNQFGFRAEALTSATNNFGFYSNIASGSNRWNFYAAGTAQNYFAGNVGIGTTSPSTKLHLSGAGTTSTAYTNGDATGATLYLQDTGGGSGNGGQILFGASQGIFAGIKGFITNGTGPSGALLFQTRNTSGNVDARMSIAGDGGVGVGTTASGGAGSILATGNITAYYSDARLKDFKGKIGDALYKISQLNGYYYTENEKAEEFGFKNKELQVGVSAQEVNAIMPEVVSAAPFDLDRDGNSKSGENYMTVNYEKLVPLLIEAIKELKAEVEALKAAK